MVKKCVSFNGSKQRRKKANGKPRATIDRETEMMKKKIKTKTSSHRPYTVLTNDPEKII